MKHIPFILTGIVFGITMTKSEVISWFRIYEMFRFESFHMYGVIGVAVALSALILWLMKRYDVTTVLGTKISYKPMQLNVTRHLLAGTIFGLGWALMGSCPGPMYVLLGNGFGIFVVVLLGAFLGTLVYGAFGQKLPH